MPKSARSLLKDILWVIFASGIVAVALRLFLGLGKTTGLTDTTPWGLWIAFKLCFVALAGGGFTLAAMVYIFHLETYHPLARRAVLVALLGYGSFIVSLIFDLGLPWHIYMPVIRWQHHSVMFEIAWCVLLYFSVLILEFGPALLEHPWLQGRWFQVLYRLLRRLVVPIVVLGVILSTLHQSSLGALFLIMPHRVHPLWYTPLLPVLFFVSAIAAGLMALVLESHIAQKLFGRGLNPPLVFKLGRIASFALWIYLALRLGDLFVRGVLPGALDGSWQSMIFLAEIGLGGLLPAVLLSFSKIRSRTDGLVTCAILVVLGIVSQRMSLSLFTMQRPLGVPYSPSFLEAVIAFAIPSAALLIYLFFNEQLAILEETRPAPEEQPVRFDPGTRLPLGEPRTAVLLRRTGLAVAAAALVIALLPLGSATGQNTPTTPVLAATGWEEMVVDGNRSNYAVLFPHAEHQQRQLDKFGGDSGQACAVCHHVQTTSKVVSACAGCHSDFYQPVAAFDHTFHQGQLGGNASCSECHLEEHSPEAVVACTECHADLVSASGQPVTALTLSPGYLDAMHGQCRDCHEQEAAARNKPELAQCAACHGVVPAEEPLPRAGPAAAP